MATPRYAAPGCAGLLYKSAVVVREDDPASSLADMRGRRCAVNEPRLEQRNELAARGTGAACGEARFFGSVVVSGSHRRSIELIVANEADVAAVDCVTFAHLQSIDPALTSRVRVLSWTPPSPCLPFVTARPTGAVTLARLRSALAAVFADPSLASVRRQLLLEGVDLAPDVTLKRVLKLEREALDLRYRQLH